MGIAEWTQDHDKAVATAKRENKLVLIGFFNPS